jgi:hypothetical protein
MKKKIMKRKKYLPIIHIEIEGGIHIQEIIIEDKNILLQDQDQDHIQEEEIHQNIGIQNTGIAGKEVSTIITIIEGIDIVEDIIEIIQVEEVKIDIGKKRKNQ